VKTRPQQKIRSLQKVAIEKLTFPRDLDAVGAAHGANIIHELGKPPNILIRGNDSIAVGDLAVFRFDGH